MNCPVCNASLEFSISGLDEFYYDCSHCNSSLLLKNGECEILSEGNIQSPQAQTELKEELTDQSLQNESQEGYAEENGRQGRPLSETNGRQGEAPSEENIPQGVVEGEVKLEPEEDFIPDESTKVPELDGPEEERHETPEDDSLAQDTSPAQEEDFPFTDEKTTPPPSTSEDSFSVELPEQEQSKPDESPPEQQKEDFAEVAKFGNTQDQDREGPFLYNLTLSEINSQDTREKVLEVLEDEALNLPVKEDSRSFKTRIQDGQITIEKISPVKVYVIVSSLMGLPLQISWTQAHFTD